VWHRQGAAGSHDRAGVPAGCEGERNLRYSASAVQCTSISLTPDIQPQTKTVFQMHALPYSDCEAGVNICDANFVPLASFVTKEQYVVKNQQAAEYVYGNTFDF